MIKSTNRRVGVVVRASASQLVDLGFISQVESYQKILKNGICSFPAWRSANRDSVENKPASSLVVSLGKALNRTPPPLCERQVARSGEVWASPGVLAQNSLYDEHNQNKLD